MTPSSGIAVFDFDGTLVRGDSLLPFLAAVRGWPLTLGIYATSVAVFYFRPWPRAKRLSAIKDRVLKKLLGGVRVEALSPAIEKLKKWPRWIAPTLAAIQDHRAKGHHILIASGSLDVYLPALLEKVPYDAILCTSLKSEAGVLTGDMASGNCVRALKAERVAAYIKENGPFAESWGYGNAPHDLPMLELLQHRTVV